MSEIWKDIIGYEGYYRISTFGRVRSLIYYHGSNNRILKQWSTPNGYLQVELCKRGCRKSYNVHRLVLGAFMGQCPDKYQCRHLDGNCRNNNLVNLQWGTASENSADRIIHGTVSYGMDHPNSKLIDDDIREIRLLSGKGISQRQLSRIFNISRSTVSSILKGETWKGVK